MDEAFHTLRRVAETIPTPALDVDGVRRTARRRSTRRKIVAGGLALLVAAAGLVLVVDALRDAGTRPATPGTSGPLDATTLTYAWSVEIASGSSIDEVLQDESHIFVPTPTGAVAYPKACSDPCQPVWNLEVVEADGQMGQSMTQMALEDDLLVVETGGRIAVAATDCGGDETCEPLWYADPIAGSSGYSGPMISDGVVMVITNEGDVPGNRQTAVAFEARCRDDGGECAPIWRAGLGSGTAYIPGVAVDGVFYQQVGARMFGLATRCRTDGGACGPDLLIEATGDPQTQESTLFGPVRYDGALVVASGDGNVSAYPEHCGTACDPVWTTPVADLLESAPMLAGDLFVLSHDGGITAVPGACEATGDGACGPSWRANLDGYWSIHYADEDVVVAASHFRKPRGLAVLPANCTDPCQPDWTAEFDGELYGVASDGTTVFASDGQQVLAYPIACSDPCAPVWATELEGAAWNLLIDDRNLVVTTQTSSEGLLGVGVTVFAADPIPASGAPDTGDPGYELRNVKLEDVVTEHDGARTAVVSYEIAWSGGEWPGYMDCRVEIIDAEGSRIAEQAFETMSLRPHPLPDVIAVDVPSGEPTRAEMSCGEAHRPSESAAYVITDPVVEGTANDPRLVFDVTWATEEPPLYQACEAALQRHDGTIGIYPFGLSVGPGRAVVLLMPGFADALVLDVSCHPYRTPDDVEASAADVVSVDPMPASILENASADLIPEWQRRVTDWAAEIGAEGMSDQELVATMDVLTRAITGSFLAKGDWVRERELMMRRTYLCQLLPSNHPYRGGEFCT